MPIIGKLIQRSTAISFKRISRKSPNYKQQLEALRQNIEVAKKTNSASPTISQVCFNVLISFQDINNKSLLQNTTHFTKIGLKMPLLAPKTIFGQGASSTLRCLPEQLARRVNASL